jgi:hypothetical protein
VGMTQISGDNHRTLRQAQGLALTHSLMLASISRRRSGRDTDTSKLIASKPRGGKGETAECQMQAIAGGGPYHNFTQHLPSTRPMPRTVGVSRRDASNVT